MARTWRRLGVIGAAVAIIAVAGLWYARPERTAVESSAASNQKVLSGPFSPTYDFLTPTLGWVLVVDYSAYRTRAWIFKTVDGGARWERQYFARAVGDRTYLHFFDPLNGFAFAGFSYRTVDGGAHWLTIDVPGTRPYVTFGSPTQGWAEVFDARGPRLYATVDGGKHWSALGSAPPGSSVLQPAFETQSPTFRDNCEGWLGAGRVGRPVVFVTTDCGNSWQTIGLSAVGPIEPDATYLTSVKLLAGGGVAVFFGTETIAALVSSDRFTTSNTVFLPAAVTTSGDITFVGSSDWWLFHAGRIYTTTDAGTSWRQVLASGLPEGWTTEAARAIDRSHAWLSLVSSADPSLRALAVTADGGAHWQTAGEPFP